MRILTMTCVIVSALLSTATASIADELPRIVGSFDDSRQADDAMRPGWLPDMCQRTMSLVSPRVENSADKAAARWNSFYTAGLDALRDEDLAAAELSFCRALSVARYFDQGDLRFAETLDELGLIRYLQEDYVSAEALQGAAVTERLLAMGPPQGDLCKLAAQSCLSSVATYMTRLGWIFEQLGRARAIDPLMAEPDRIFALGYVPADALVSRLGGLISEYLLIEDYAAARRLTALMQALLSELARSNG